MVFFILVLGRNLFPNKVKDLKGKKITLAGFNYPSYAILRPFEKGSKEAKQFPLKPSPMGDILSRRGQGYQVVEGTEMRIALEWARIHNATWMVLDTPVGEWGEIFDNGTGNGVLGAVFEDRADMGFTALYLWWNEWLTLDFAVPNARSGITCLAPRPRPLDMWLTPVLPFNRAMWTAVGLAYLFSSLAGSLQSRLAASK